MRRETHLLDLEHLFYYNFVIMSILQRLLEWMGLRQRSSGSRYFEVSESLHISIQTLAKHEGRSEQELLPDLLAAGLTQYRSKEEVWLQWEALTQREQDVTAYVCLGLTNRQIAERLTLSPETIKTHVRNILIKFGLSSKRELRHILAGWDFSGWM